MINIRPPNIQVTKRGRIWGFLGTLSPKIQVSCSESKVLPDFRPQKRPSRSSQTGRLEFSCSPPSTYSGSCIHQYQRIPLVLILIKTPQSAPKFSKSAAARRGFSFILRHACVRGGGGGGRVASGQAGAQQCCAWSVCINACHREQNLGQLVSCSSQVGHSFLVFSLFRRGCSLGPAALPLCLHRSAPWR